MLLDLLEKFYTKQFESVIYQPEINMVGKILYLEFKFGHIGPEIKV